MASKLSPFAGQLADCIFLSGDMEAFSFSSEIASVLREAKWRAIPPSPNVMVLKETSLPTTASPIEKIDFGVELASTSDPEAIAAARAIVEELEHLGFDAHFRPSIERPQASRIWLTVEHRPQGAQGEAKLRSAK